MDEVGDGLLGGRRVAVDGHVALMERVLTGALEELVRAEPRIAAQLTCLDPACYRSGQSALLADARAHTIAARRRGLDLVTQAEYPAWKWNHLARKAAGTLTIAAQINTAVQRGGRMTRIDTGPLTATFVYADNCRQTLVRRRAA